MIQKIGKIIICLISMVCILMALRVNTSVAYTYSRPNNNTWRDSIVVWNASKSESSDPQTVKLSKDKKVVLVQGGYKSDAIYTDNIGVTQCSIVCQPNVYCVQHGTGLDLGSYKASKVFNVDTSQDAGKILAYIVNQNTSTSLSTDWVTPYQVALWKYLYAYKDKENATDANQIVNDILINDATSVNEAHDLSQNDLDEADKIIEAAKKYATNLNVNPTLSVSKENGNIKITTDAQNYEIYLNGTLYKEGENSQFTGDKSIPISTALNYTTTGQVTVQVKSILTQYTASYRILYSYYDVNDQLDDGQQRIIVITGLKKITKKNASTTVTEALDANVSMQKYITSVSDINGNNKTTVDSRDSYLSRENDMNNNDSDSLGVVYKTKYDRDPSKSKSKKTPYKYDNPVKIDYGDKVTYTIEVSNNGAYPVENVVIRDAFPKIGDNIVVDINSIELNKNGNEMNTSSVPNSGMNYLISNSIAAGETKKFTITMKFNSDALKQRTDIIANTAWVEAVYSNVNGSVGLKGKNLKRDYRTADRDYVQMKQYAVSLEKYVVGVNGYRLEDFDNNGKVDGKQDAQLISEYTTNGELTDSVKNKIYRYGDLNKDGDINSADSLFFQRMVTGKESIQNCREGSAIWYDTTSKYKENHPVQVETGDKVTFKIKLTNKGEGNIKVSKIKDTFTNDATKKLILKSITGNGEGTISGNIITFNNPLEIKAGESTFIEVTFEVTTENLNSEHRLNNTAEITEMKNRNNQSILSWDNDGTDNNKDTDYLKVLKQYAVGLNKFITKVNNADLITNTDNLLYNYNSTDRSGLSKTDKSTDANKVRVEPGDTVIYTLRLTNTSPTDEGHSAIKVSKIEDIPQKINNNCYLDYDSSYKITENGGGTVAKNGNKLTITFSKPEEIYPGKYLDITIRFKVVVKDSATATYQTLENTATVTEIKNRNNITVNDVDGTGNNSNSDYIKTKIYAVGIEKYVTGVGTTKDNANSLVINENPNYNCATSDRSGKTKDYKEADSVRVEPGDYVTFTIKVKNTGTKDGKADYENYGKISTTTISESFTENANCKLVYDSITGATYDKKQITFKKDIVPGGSATFTIKFKVEVTGNLTGSQQNLENKATISDKDIITNKHTVEVKDSDGDKNNTDSDYLRTKIYKVALEKYVTGVGENGLITSTDNINYNCNVNSRENHPNYAKNEYDKSTEDNRVRVEPGDYVTFTIKVKNTGAKDGKADYANYGKISTTTISESFTENANCKLVYDSITGATYDKKQITFKKDIVPGGSATFTIKFKVEVTGNLTGSQQNLENKATISDKDIITNKHTVEVKDSDGDKNNTDSDYLRTKIYKVALEKYVTGVGENGLITSTDNINYNCNVNSRENHPNYAKNEYDKSTEDNRVRVEPGDYVTFTIKVKNTGTDYANYGKISTTTISESFTENANCKLVYDSITGATYDKKQITFKKDIVPGGSATFTIKFKVEVTGNLTGSQQNLENKATISDKDIITNKHTVEVKDSDGDKNNTDSDYLRTKIYKVALEKYVTKVNRYDLSTTAGKDYNVKELTNRKGKPTYDTDKSKENDIVNLETGDTVTFAITVKNIGDDYKNYGTVKTLNITDTSSKELKYNNVCDGARYSDGNITGVSAINVGDETTISLEYNVELNENQTKQKIDLYNHAEIVDTSIINKNDISVKDSDGTTNNKDEDYLRTKVYAVSLEKFVSKVEMNGTDITDAINMGPQKEGMDRPREGYAEHNYNNLETTEENCDKTKRKNPVTTVTGDSVTYTILLKNDSKAKTGIDTTKDSNNDKNSYNTAVKIGKVIDYLPNGMKYGKNEYTNDNYEVTYDFETSNGQNLSNGRLLYPGETAIVTITATVIEDKMSLNILKNVAEINEDSLTNKNGSKVYDTTENNNKDADYIQLNYKHDPNPEDPEPGDDDNIFFAGTVWNDMALSKAGEYNKIMDDEEMDDEEDILSGITVELYREEYDLKTEISYTPKTHLVVAKTTTGNFGNYSFGDNDIVISEQREKYIKGPKISNEDNRWAGYYKYYIVFTYDGITYTSTDNGTYCEDIYNDEFVHYTKDSNASEGNIKELKDTLKYETRTDFNARFETINNKTKIKYNTINKNEYIPESQYIYDPEIMSMKSTTNLIDISTFLTSKHSSDTYLERSKYIGLGLRGRDIFDLELTSDVSQIKTTVNGQIGVYNYSNKLAVRDVDVDEKRKPHEDMANLYGSERLDADRKSISYVTEGENQKVRNTDVKLDEANEDTIEKYTEKQLLSDITVTYKITVTNASKTSGKVTQVMDYIDENYDDETIKEVWAEKYNNEGKITGTYTAEAKVDDKIKGVNCIPVLITVTNSPELNSEERLDIYLSISLKEPKQAVLDQIKTYNMAEIYKYTTTQYGDDDEKTYTKGILDKDSAPGSVATEKVRLTEGTSELTTLKYYFAHNELNKLKYEDDTYATPTLFFKVETNDRELSGTVFEDYTDVYTDQRIRTGNGVKDNIEPGIKGAKVQLLEKCTLAIYNSVLSEDKKYKQDRNHYYVVRYEKHTDTDGNFKVINYLPGNYIMRYFYGDNQETFYIGNTNTKSYNGEDFQATNNSKKVDDADVHFLSTIEDYWYTYNYDEGVSTATDIANMRKDVSKEACNLSDNEMELLNNVRDGKVKAPESGKEEVAERKSLRNKLAMQAKTKQFTLTVEQSEEGKQNDKFTTYKVKQMNFGIAEVPVTTIDLQKHVNLFEIKDSTGENTIASAEITDTYIVEINKHNITDENKYNKVKAALKNAGITGYTFDGYSTDKYGDKIDNENTTVNDQVNKINVDKLRGYLITYSIPNIITITPTWKTVGNVLPGVKATNTVLDVSIEDAKLQGAKLKITYDIAVSMYAEKDFSGTAPLQPSIDKVIDLIDNGVSYSDSLNTEGQWKVAKASELKRGDSDLSETRGLESYPSTEFTTTIIESDSSNDLLQVKSGYSNSKNNQVTVERVLTSQDTSIQDIITSSIDAFEYQNTVKILQLDYTNSKVKIEGEEIKNKDRIRTPERYIIVPGKHHDSATSETIAIHPPTGDTSTHTMYYIIGAAGLAVLAIVAFGIKKFVLKGKSTKK